MITHKILVVCLFTVCAAVPVDDAEIEQFSPSPRMVPNYAELDEVDDDDEDEFLGLEDDAGLEKQIDELLAIDDEFDT